MATTVRKGQMYVNGEFVDAADGKTRTITSPATLICGAFGMGGSPSSGI